MTIRIALSTGSLHTYGTARTFELAAETGFDAIEVLVDQRWDTRQPGYLRRLSQSSGLPVAVVHSPFVPSVPGWPLDPIGRLRASAAVARELGAQVVVAHLPLRIWIGRLELLGSRASSRLFAVPLPSRSGYRSFLMNGLAEFEASEGVRIAVENMPAKWILGRRVDVFSLNRVADLARLPHLTLDTTHLATWGLDPVAVYDRLRERVVHVHLSNYNGKQHRLPEDGRLPLARLLQTLRHDGYRGMVSLEFDPEALDAEDEARVRAHLVRALSFCREHAQA